MGQSKDGGYIKQPTSTTEQGSFIQNLLSQGVGGGGTIGNQSLEGLAAFLPGGTGFQPIAGEARRGFQEQTLPGIMEALGSQAKGSSAVNQAATGAGAGLESQLAALRSQMMQQSAGMGLQGAMGAAGESQFAYQPRQLPFWQQMLLAGTAAAGETARGVAGNAALFA